jgi:hypothetical protein
MFQTLQLMLEGQYGHDGFNSRRHAEGGVLRHVQPNPDDVLLRGVEDGSADGGITLHQSADINVALGDDAIERRDHRGIVAVLAGRVDLILLSGDGTT